MPKKQPLQARLARRLRELRDEHGLSQMDMVRDYGWSLSHYQKLERGVLDPRITTLERLAEEAYGLTLAELLDGV
jgi:transcriptional regulator with XRE-family HTH domain